ncbi:GTPase IMAP family member 8-like isoform X2 [Megalobrama amblycephala]|uniref:GTPase IMAP family member 8-like isoform X2 n=1 Tax=Megalobrama amblycephala TaxID=75352 RepID=UPI00201448AE|nr:GTPase IMAP family member 8-like isoform X2 [Megalobrama amblycephala]
MASAQHEPDEAPDSEDLRIVLLGVSGAGKSPTGNAILGREVFKESRTRESEIQRGRVEDRNISIIDTPGFFNTHLTDEEMKKQMMKSLYLSDPGPHVFLLVINLENFEEEQRNIVQKIQEYFGEESLLFTMVLFIGREKISKRKCTQIIESEETQKILNNFKGRFQVINSKNECDPNQITKLLKSIDEMVKNNGGQNYSNEIYLKNQLKLREQKESVKYKEKRQKQEEEIMKQEQMWKRQEKRDAWKQGEEKNQEEEIKTKHKEEKIKDHNEKKKEDVKERAQYLKVKEDLRKQMESRTEKERQRWALERRMTPRHSRLDLRIVVLGKIDVGKTATANTILGRDAFRAGAQSGTLTCEKQKAVVSGRTISITDTTGMLDFHFQHKLKRDIEECLEMSAPGPHVFLLVIRLNGRYTEEEKNTVKWIQENFGEEAVRHTFILFTHVDLLMDESLDQYIRKSPDLQSLIDSCGRRFHSFNNQDRHNQNQVMELLEKIDQLIKNNGGEHYANEMSQRAQKQDEKRQNNSEEATERQRRLQGLRRQRDLLGLMMGLELSKMALRSSLETAMMHRNLSRQDLRFVLLGLLGSGKSSTGNTILNRDAFRAGLMTTTRSSEKQEAVVFGRTISIIDTPGLLLSFLLMNIQDHDHYKIEKSLELSVPGPHVFLLVINLLGFTEEEKNTVKWFEENLEKDALNRTIILFTHGDLLNFLIDEPLIEYIEKKHNDLKSLIDSCGGRYHSFDNDEMQNRFQVIELMMKIDEMMEKNGGGHYTKRNIFKRKQDDSGCEIQ